MGELINFYGSLVCMTGSLLFVGVYTVMPFVTGRRRWWQDPVGRMLVTKASALAGLMVVPVVYYLTRADAEWIRSIRGVFSAVIGVMMVYQTSLVFRLQRQRKEDQR